MISIQDMLRLKEQELGRLQKEIDALRLVASLYGESAMIDANRPQAEVVSAPASAPAYAPVMAPVAVAPVAAPPVYASAGPVPGAIPSHGRNGGEKRFP